VHLLEKPWFDPIRLRVVLDKDGLERLRRSRKPEKSRLMNAQGWFPPPPGKKEERLEGRMSCKPVTRNGGALDCDSLTIKSSIPAGLLSSYSGCSEKTARADMCLCRATQQDKSD
jgi:hypothetical protein